MKKVIKFLPLIFTAVFLLVFAWFFKSHPEVRASLKQTPPIVLVIVFALYGLLVTCLSFVYNLLNQLCGKKLPTSENWQLTSYSTIINFFGPLQSGPGVRAGYLKQKYHIRLLDYTRVSLIYYAMYAALSGTFLLLGSGLYRLWVVAGLLVLGIIASFGWPWLKKLIPSRLLPTEGQWQPRLLGFLAFATLCQLLVMVSIYFVELRAVHTGASVSQAFAYTGAANFALFVSFTPAAIGFREAFLTFSQRLHGISTQDILAANTIDRAVFVAFLGGLFLLLLAMHANHRFQNKNSAKTS